MTSIKKHIVCLNKKITAILNLTDDGVVAIVAGGDKSHIGAISVVDKNHNQTTTFAGHKETEIASKWALELFNVCNQTVVVSAGIHYDNINSSDINKVLTATDCLLNEIVKSYYDLCS